MKDNTEPFRKKSLFCRLKMPLAELEDYYRRKRHFDRNKEVRHIALRRAYSRLFIPMLGMDRALQKKKYQIIGDKRIHTGKAKIYACTHAGSTDISVVYEALKDHCYWFWGDIGEYYRKIDGLLVWLNGAVLIDTRDKQDRRNAMNTAIKVLKKGGNILIFPEGSWNITENKPVMHLYTGAVEMAIESGADIIPVGIEIYGNTFYINIGRNISSINMATDSKQEYTEALRNAMAALKWEIWEQHGQSSRASLPDNISELWQKHIRKMCDEVNFPIEEVYRTMYAYKPDLELKQIRKDLASLVPCSENAFLYNKRNHY